ncbi:MAG: amidase, partial [Halieaceae bacterium]|nr:amidase [Halieaceae bacterium]
DSEMVRRYKAAGLVVFGKSASPEFGLTTTTESKLFGVTKNPWKDGATAGGSSGGAAAAVAAGILPAANASDGGGSIRVPASCCGLFGLKPSRGRVPFGPDAGEGWNGMSTIHAVTRSVRDSAALLDAVCAPERGAPYAAPPQARPYLDEVGAAPGRLRIALQTDAFNGAPVHADCVDAARATAKLLGE